MRGRGQWTVEDRTKAIKNATDSKCCATCDNTSVNDDLACDMWCCNIDFDETCYLWEKIK